MRKTAFTAVAAGVSLLAAAGAGMGTAFADPSGSPTYRTYVAVGSDTTESVMDGMASAVGGGLLGSYDASNGSATINTRGSTLSAATAAGATSITTASQIIGAQVGDQIGVGTDTATLSGTLPTASPWTYTLSGTGLATAHSVGDLVSDNRCTFTRPVGSGAGRSVLDASINNKAWSGNTANSNLLGGCADIARSSSYSSAVYTTAHELTYIPFGYDAVTFATLATSNVPRQLSLGQLKSIYQCTYSATPTDPAAQTIKPVLPQSNSGTRQFFLTSIGLSGSAMIPASGVGSGTGLGACVDDGLGPFKGDAGGTGYVENNGTVLTDPNQLVPFSTGQYIAQVSGQQTNNLGRAALGAESPSTASAPPSDARSALFINNVASSAVTIPGDANAVFPSTREVYNVVQTARITNTVQAPSQNSPTLVTTGGTQAAGTYYYVVTATGATGETTASNEKSVTVAAGNSVQLSWNPSIGAAGYNVYRGTTAGGENTLVATVTGGSANSYTDTGAAGTAGTPPASNTATSTSSILDSNLVSLLVGSTSTVCNNVATIAKYGFDPASDCGSTAKTTG